MILVTTQGLRETKRAELSQTLAETAFALVRENGFGVVTVDDIVKVAKVSRRTFSNYYSCKEAAVAAVVEHRMRERLDGWQPPGTTAGLVALVGDLVAHQLSSGAMVPFVEVAALTREHPQLVPHFREAQWRVWSLAGERVQAVSAPLDATARLELGAILGAVFGVVTTVLNAEAEVAEHLPSQLTVNVTRVLSALGRCFPDQARSSMPADVSAHPERDPDS